MLGSTWLYYNTALAHRILDCFLNLALHGHSWTSHLVDLSLQLLLEQFLRVFNDLFELWVVMQLVRVESKCNVFLLNSSVEE